GSLRSVLSLSKYRGAFLFRFFGAYAGGRPADGGTIPTHQAGSLRSVLSLSKYRGAFLFHFFGANAGGRSAASISVLRFMLADFVFHQLNSGCINNRSRLFS
ncbi:MAG TPA: hypothetical protein PLT49_03510, partial [Ferruginibacter sp.]|nr:hypothetical protein [Ferruginibacter sp.]